MKGTYEKMEGRYEKLLSVEYKDYAPFPRTIIIEEDSVKGKRETCLAAKVNEIGSEVCTSLKLLKQEEKDKIRERTKGHQ